MNREVELSELLTLVQRAVTVEKHRSYPMMGVRSFARGAFRRGELAGGETSYNTLQIVRAGDLVYPKLMAWEGAFAVVPPELDGAYVSPEFCVFERVEAQLDLIYMKHLFAHKKFLDRLTATSTGTNVRRRRLKPGDFLRCRILLPSLEDQRQRGQAMEYAEARAAVASSDDPRGDSGIDSWHDKIFESGSSGAERACIRDLLVPCADSITVNVHDTYPNVGILSHSRGLFKKEDISGLRTSHSRLFPLRSGQLVYSKLFAWEGAAAIVPDKYAGHVVSSEFPRFELRSGRLNLNFLSHALRTSCFGEQVGRLGAGLGQRRKRVNVADFVEIEIPVPSLEVQREISAELQRLARVRQLQRHRRRLAAALPESLRSVFLSDVRVT